MSKSPLKNTITTKATIATIYNERRTKINLKWLLKSSIFHKI
jgi:hypothetical protein